MKAALQRAYGAVDDVVELADVELPGQPTDDRVVVRVRAASVNRADLDALGPRPGFIRPFIGMRRPRDPRMGVDVAGVIEAVGPAVTRLQPGDAVMGDMFVGGDGAFAEFTTAPERAFQTIPSGMTFAEAATLPHSAILALQGLRRRNYTKADYTRAGEHYDWIVDTDTHHSISRVRRALRPGGVYVTLGGNSGAILSGIVVGPLRSLRSDRWSGLLLWWKPMHPPDVERLKELIAAGSVRPVIDRRYALDQIVDALRLVDERKAHGKVVIDVADGDVTPRDQRGPNG